MSIGRTLIVWIGTWLMIGQIVFAATLSASLPAASPDESFIGRIYYPTVADIDELHDYNIDLHEYNNRAEKYVLAGMDDDTLARLTAAGWRVVPDERATNVYNAMSRSADRTDQSGTFYGGYRTVSTTFGIMSDTAAAYPTITELIDYGDSYCKLNSGGCVVDGTPLDGFDLLAIRVGSKENLAIPAGNIDRPALFLIAQIHAREITTSEQALFLLDHLTSNYGTDPDITWLVDWRDIYIIPIANPDGHYIVETVNAPNVHRKNARLTEATCSGYDLWGRGAAQRGVDLNRNHSWEWGGVGASDIPCQLTYRGESAVSEPETVALESFVRSHTRDRRGDLITDTAPLNTQDVLISMHSYSNLILYPWASTTEDSPNEASLKRISDKLGAMTGYTSQRGIDLYATSGTTDDWSYGELGIASFTYEIGDRNDGFHPVYETAMDEHWPEVRDSLIYAAKISTAPYAVAEGPEVTLLNATIISDTVQITAVVDDSDNGGNDIRAFGYMLNTPFQEVGELPNLVVEAQSLDQITGDLFVVELDPCEQVGVGEHVVYGAGYDTAQNWGTMEAITLTVPFEMCFSRVYIPAVMSSSPTPVVIASSSSIILSIASLITFALYWRKQRTPLSAILKSWQ